MEYTDPHRHIVEACLQGQRPAQFELYRLYSRAMLNVCVRMTGSVADAEDVLQVAFTEVFRKLDTFRFESSIGAWVKRIVLNHCINFLKSKRVEFEAFDDRLHDRPDDYQHQHDASDDIRLDVQHIRRGIEKLPDGYRVVLSLYLLEGYDHEEIGQILKISEQTSKSQFHRAKSRLREMLAADYSA